MSVLARFKDIMSSNVNSILDKMENPEKMIDQTLRNLMNDLADVKKETASVMAEETRTRRAVEENTAELNKNMELAKKALTAGNEDHARVFLNKKNELTTRGIELQKLYEAAAQNAAQMREMHDKLVKDINALKTRKATIKSNIAVAKTTERINKMGSAGSKAESALQTFDRFEQQAQERLDRARALTQLNEVPADEAKALAELYKDGGGAALDDELAALKAEMGLCPASSVDDEIAAMYKEIASE